MFAAGSVCPTKVNDVDVLFAQRFREFGGRLFSHRGESGFAGDEIDRQRDRLDFGAAQKVARVDAADPAVHLADVISAQLRRFLASIVVAGEKFGRARPGLERWTSLALAVRRVSQI